jgi:hypothetical protein
MAKTTLVAPQGTRPLADRRYLKRGPVLPYRGVEVLLVLLDLLVIFFGVKAVENYHARTKGERLIANAKTEEAAARKAEEEMIVFRTARKESLEIAKQQQIEARHADSLRIAELDTAVVRVVEDIEAVRAEHSSTTKRFIDADNTKKTAFKKRDTASKKLPPVVAQIELADLHREAIEDTIATIWPQVGQAEEAYQIALSERPEVVVPQQNSASVGTQVADGDVFGTVGLGRSFLSLGKNQLGLTGHAGFGADRSTVSGAGVFLNVPVIPGRASIDIGSGATYYADEEGASDTSPYLSGGLRYQLSKQRKIFLLGDTRADKDRFWTGVGIGVGRR